MANKEPLSITHPALAKEWHPTRNGDLKPDDFTYGSHQRIYWQCQKFDDHIYEARINHRLDSLGEDDVELYEDDSCVDEDEHK